MWIAILVALVAVLAIVMLKVAGGRRTAPVPVIVPTSDPVATQVIRATVPFSTIETDAVFTQCYRLAFNVADLAPPADDEHAELLDAVNKSLDESVYERDYFPRRPMLLPKLLQTLNDSESTRDQLVRVLMEDPSLAGAVLQRANSAYYRTSPEPIESLDRAVFLLGTDGLRSLAAAAILQPVFRIPRGSFDRFPEFTWEQAERSAIAAEVNARSVGDPEPIVARLLGSLSLLANIVLFRLTMDKYRDFPALQPRADVIVEAIRTQRSCVASLIAQAWKMSDLSIVAFTEQQQRMSPTHMSTLGRAVYFGDLTGALGMLTPRGHYSKTTALEMLANQGTEVDTARAMWLAAASIPQS